MLARESRSLLMGESADAKLLGEIRQIVEHDPSIKVTQDQLSMYLAPEELLLLLKVRFEGDQDGNQIATSIRRIRLDIQRSFPDVKQIYIEPELDE